MERVQESDGVLLPTGEGTTVSRQCGATLSPALSPITAEDRLALVISTGVKCCAQRLVLVRQVGWSYYYPGDGRIRAWRIGAGTRPYIYPILSIRPQNLVI